ncbi:46271_t:CDS:2, partial [Gigaspora margarita]
MSSFICSICACTFTSKIGYSQYRNSCIKTVDYDDNSQISPNPYSKNHSFTKDFKNIQDNRSKENLCNISKDIKVDNNMLIELEDENNMSFK